MGREKGRAGQNDGGPKAVRTPENLRGLTSLIFILVVYVAPEGEGRGPSDFEQWRRRRWGPGEKNGEARAEGAKGGGDAAPPLCRNEGQREI